MCKKSKSPDATLGGIRCGGLIFLVSVVFVLGSAWTSPAEAADPDLVGWWKFDEGSGSTAADSSNYSNHGTLSPSPDSPTWVTGKIEGALSKGEEQTGFISDQVTLNARVCTIGFCLTTFSVKYCQHM